MISADNLDQLIRDRKKRDRKRDSDQQRTPSSAKVHSIELLDDDEEGQKSLPSNAAKGSVEQLERRKRGREVVPVEEEDESSLQKREMSSDYNLDQLIRDRKKRYRKGDSEQRKPRSSAKVDSIEVLDDDEEGQKSLPSNAAKNSAERPEQRNGRREVVPGGKEDEGSLQQSRGVIFRLEKNGVPQAIPPSTRVTRHSTYRLKRLESEGGSRGSPSKRTRQLQVRE